MSTSISALSTQRGWGVQGGGYGGGAPPDPATMAKRFIERFDGDGSGSVDQAELSKALTAKGVSNADGVTSKMIADLGGSDGKVTADSAQSAFAAKQQEMDALRTQVAMNQQLAGMQGRPPGPPPDGGQGSGHGGDRGGAGAIDASAMFSAIDTDGDGSISKSELGALLSAARGAGQASGTESSTGASSSDASASTASSDASASGSTTASSTSTATSTSGSTSSADALLRELMDAIGRYGGGHGGASYDRTASLLSATA